MKSKDVAGSAGEYEVKPHSFLPHTTEQDYERGEEAIREYYDEALNLERVMEGYLKDFENTKNIRFNRNGKREEIKRKYSDAFQRLSAIYWRSSAILDLADGKEGGKKNRALGAAIQDRVDVMKKLYKKYQNAPIITS